MVNFLINSRSIILILIISFFTSDLAAQTKPVVSTHSTRPFILGVVDEVQSVILGEKRILNIYLPEGYNAKDTTKYAVAYLLDGSGDEDFIHVSGLYQFNTFEWINLVPKTIVVGIATVDRRRDFTFPTTIAEDKKRYPTTGASQPFISFIEKELQPFIEKHYKVNNNRTIIGQSLGGLLATEILLKRPQLFNKYVIVSPSLWWNNGSLLEFSTSLVQNISDSTKIYIGVGKEGLTSTKIPRVMEVDAHLLADKIKKVNNKNVTVFLDYLPEEDHATIMHQAVFNALRKLYNKQGTSY